MVVRMRHTRSHTANRRSHHALIKAQLTLSKEGVAHPRHKALLDGTMYRGRSVMNTATKRLVRAQKAAKKRGDEPVTEEKKTEQKV